MSGGWKHASGRHEWDVRRRTHDGSVLLGSADLVREARGRADFHRELDGPRKPDNAASERRIGISNEIWYIAATPSGDQFVAYMESDDFTKALSMFVESRDEFDMWFKRRLAEAAGVDLNDPPRADAPRARSSYQSP